MFRLYDEKFRLFRVSGVGWCRVSSGWFSWNYNQLSQAKAEAEFGKNESCSSTWVDHKTVVEPYPNAKKSTLGPKKWKNYPKIK